MKIKELIPYLGKRKTALFCACLFLLLSSFTVLLLGKFLENLIDIGFAGDGSGLSSALSRLFIVMLCLSIFTFLRYFFITYAAEAVITDLRKDVYKHLVNLSIDFFERTGIAEILSRLSTDTEILQSVLATGLSIVVRNMLLFIGGVVMLIATNARLLLYAAYMILPVIVIVLIFGRLIRRASYDNREKSADMIKFCEETLSGITQVKAFNQTDYSIERFDALANRVFCSAVRRIQVRACIMSFVIIVVFGVLTAILSFGGNEVFKGMMSKGQLSSFLFYCILTATSLAAILQTISDVYQAHGAAERLFQFLATECSVKENTDAVNIDKEKFAFLAFANVTFAYPMRPEHMILHNFSLRIKAGEKVAIVGKTGAGKSTLIKLILRFYDPVSGFINLNGRNIKDLSFDSLRNRLALVSQDVIIFSGTLEYNIKYGRADADDIALQNLLSCEAIADLVTGLPEGFKTYIGEKGLLLSGGQKQCVAIARAMIRKADILLLDEATSSLDSKSEKLIQNSLDKLTSECTSIVIAHRLSTILNADRIIVMHEGAIDAVGTHEELLQVAGLYRELINIQFGFESR